MAHQRGLHHHAQRSRIQQGHGIDFNPHLSSRRTGTRSRWTWPLMAAGKGTRMRSKIPKVLQRLAGPPPLQHVVETAADLQARHVVVITGHGAMEVEAAMR